MKPKIIKTDEEHAAALAHMRTLMDAAPGSPDEELPDPVDAIEFRMDQAGLTRKDLGKYLGSASKVSEIMNRRRPLTLTMMRALHEGLGIPAEVLFQTPGRQLPHEYKLAEFPFAEMFRKGYFGEWAGTLRAARSYSEELLGRLLGAFESRPPQLVYCRRGVKEINPKALLAWQARSLALAELSEVEEFVAEALNEHFLSQLVRASYHAEGPRLVPDLLARRGIHFVLLSHLEQTYLDGACFMTEAGQPVLGLTLRFDRLDNFWFTLVHELAHVKLHLHSGGPGFFDDTEHGVCPEDDPVEQQADAFTRNALIPDAVWEIKGPRLRADPNEDAVIALAETLEISPAIIAGRIRWETKNYAVLTPLVGSGEVRRLFQDLYQP
jgi:HTH-type transcriptional regulator/antitoxin HigA